MAQVCGETAIIVPLVFTRKFVWIDANGLESWTSERVTTRWDSKTSVMLPLNQRECSRMTATIAANSSNLIGLRTSNSLHYMYFHMYAC